MDNYVQPGEVLPFIAPIGGVVSGGLYVIGGALVVATVDAAAGATFSGLLEGTIKAAKNAGEVWAVGDVVYWDAGNSRFTKTAGANRKSGMAASVQASADVEGNVRLDGIVV